MESTSTATAITAVFALTRIATLNLKLVDFLRYLKARDWNGVLTQAIAWTAGR